MLVWRTTYHQRLRCPRRRQTRPACTWLRATRCWFCAGGLPLLDSWQVAQQPRAVALRLDVGASFLTIVHVHLPAGLHFACSVPVLRVRLPRGLPTYKFFVPSSDFIQDRTNELPSAFTLHSTIPATDRRICTPFHHRLPSTTCPAQHALGFYFGKHCATCSVCTTHRSI